MENTLSNLSKPEKEATHLRSKPKGIQTLNNDNNTPYLLFDKYNDIGQHSIYVLTNLFV